MSQTFKHTRLDNGLTIVAEPDSDAHTAAVGFFVRTGARDETGSLMGVSHFLEHMMFKGTERRSAAQVNQEFDDIGANYNASTSQEVTTYYAHVLPEHLAHAIDLFTDMLRPALREEDFEVEKQVILEEIGMYEDRPFWVVLEHAMEQYFGDHPLGYRILGTQETVGALTRQQMLDYFEHRYSPDNIVVSLAGKLDFDACVEQIAAACGSWPQTGATRDTTPPPPQARDQRLVKANTNMQYFVGVTPGPSAQDDERYAAAVLAHVLGDSDGSRLYWKLIDPGYADEAELSHHAMDGTGQFLFFASCDPEKAVQVEDLVLETIHGAAEDLTAEELERAASKIAMDMTLQNERPPGRMMNLGSQWLYLHNYIPLEQELERVQAVTADELRRLIERYPFAPQTLIRMSPG